MLVLSRKKNEKIRVNDNVVITVIEVRGDKVRLGFEAPREVRVHREEVYQAIQRGEHPPEAKELQPPVTARDGKPAG